MPFSTSPCGSKQPPSDGALDLLSSAPLLPPFISLFGARQDAGAAPEKRCEGRPQAPPAAPRQIDPSPLPPFADAAVPAASRPPSASPAPTASSVPGGRDVKGGSNDAAGAAAPASRTTSGSASSLSGDARRGADRQMPPLSLPSWGLTASSDAGSAWSEPLTLRDDDADTHAYRSLPCELRHSFSKPAFGGATWMRVVEQRTLRGNRLRRVAVVAADALLLCDVEGDTKRTLALSDIVSIDRCYRPQTPPGSPVRGHGASFDNAAPSQYVTVRPAFENKQVAFYVRDTMPGESEEAAVDGFVTCLKSVMRAAGVEPGMQASTPALLEFSSEPPPTHIEETAGASAADVSDLRRTVDGLREERDAAIRRAVRAEERAAVAERERDEARRQLAARGDESDADMCELSPLTPNSQRVLPRAASSVALLDNADDAAPWLAGSPARAADSKQVEDKEPVPPGLALLSADTILARLGVPQGAKALAHNPRESASPMAALRSGAAVAKPPFASSPPTNKPPREDAGAALWPGAAAPPKQATTFDCLTLHHAAGQSVRQREETQATLSEDAFGASVPPPSSSSPVSAAPLRTCAMAASPPAAPPAVEGRPRDPTGTFTEQLTRCGLTHDEQKSLKHLGVRTSRHLEFVTLAELQSSLSAASIAKLLPHFDITAPECPDHFMVASK
eukprot:TRINITY_DN5273_c0_g4_i1.p1 TRINITY_DN5273_c0_g4~~TRINITY_DN5273_c0_g4_i1.p1  ORF type:complete len:694 (+),score=150.28 TRINITY_DN5273_c0_g4_i1:51-2084(+)